MLPLPWQGGKHLGESFVNFFQRREFPVREAQRSEDAADAADAGCRGGLKVSFSLGAKAGDTVS